jgi:hypothetical protein
VDWSLLLAGLFGLAGLVGSGLYPGSMVGVPGERSNMAPPTLCIIACAVPGGRGGDHPSCHAAQVAEERWARASSTINRFSLPLFLFHSTGMAAWLAVRYLVAGENNEATAPTAGWWLTRPLAVIGPLLFTLPVIYLSESSGSEVDGEPGRRPPE